MIACCIAYGVTVSYFMDDYAMVMRCGMPCFLLALLGLDAIDALLELLQFTVQLCVINKYERDENKYVFLNINALNTVYSQLLLIGLRQTS